MNIGDKLELEVVGRYEGFNQKGAKYGIDLFRSEETPDDCVVICYTMRRVWAEEYFRLIEAAKVL